jgi:F420 biosynthesis protein FbiB-like protein
LLEQLLETATRAPSAHNRQPWRFAVLETAEAIKRLALEMGRDYFRDLTRDGMSAQKAEELVARSRERIQGAPVVVVLCYDPSVMDTYDDPDRQEAEYLMGVQSVALAGGTMLLAAHAEGLGGVWVCAPLFTPSTVRSALKTPERWEPQGMLLLGYPAKIPDFRARKSLDEVVMYVA